MTQQESNVTQEMPTYLTIRQFSEKHKFLTENSIRWMLFKEIEGIENCIIRLNNRRIFIDEKAFFLFLQNQKQK